MHENILSSVKAGLKKSVLQTGDSILSYMPFTHSYEQIMFSMSLYLGLKVGFYQGNPLKLLDDC